VELLIPNSKSYMTKKYAKLFQLGLHHTFYAEKIARNLSIEPTPFSKMLMRKYDLRMVNQADGISIYYGEDGRQSIANLLTGSIKLSFLLKSNDPYFINYTALPLLGQEDKKYSFSNIRNMTPSPEAQALQLKEFVGLEDSLAFIPMYYEYELEVDTTSVDFTLTDIRSKQTRAQELIGWDILPQERGIDGNVMKKPLLRFDLSREAWGRYELAIEEATPIHFGLLPGNLFPQVMGMIEIVVGQLIQADGTQVNFLIKDEEIHPQDYTITFDARKTTWRYYLINRHQINTETISINEGLAGQANGESNEVALIRPIELNGKLLTNGESATLIELSDARVLQERPSSFLHLVLSSTDIDSGDTSKVSINLPLAGTKQIQPEIQENTVPDQAEEEELLQKRTEGRDLDISDTSTGGYPKHVKEIQRVYSDIYVYL